MYTLKILLNMPDLFTDDRLLPQLVFYNFPTIFLHIQIHTQTRFRSIFRIFDYLWSDEYETLGHPTDSHTVNSRPLLTISVGPRGYFGIVWHRFLYSGV